MDIAYKFRDNIPVYQEVLGDLAAFLADDRSLAVLYIGCSRIERIERLFGKKICQDALSKIHSIILEMKGNVVRCDDIIVSGNAGSDEFFVFLSKKREDETFYPSDLETLCDRVTAHLNDRIFPIVVPFLRGKPNIDVGYAVIIHNPVMSIERHLSKLTSDAKKMADYQRFKRLMRDKEKLQELILKESIRTLFQPIVDLEERRIIGYEALTRGPEGTEYENPFVLFDAASDAEMIFELDSLCRLKALRNARGLHRDHKLFLNCMPSAILDPNFQDSSIQLILKELKITPSNLVIEVTEREAIENFELFKEALAYYSSIGFSIAVDDTCSGYSSLETVIELKPHYIKLDMSIVRDIHKNILKQELIRAINTLSVKMNSQIIAEGIETAEELKALSEIGIKLGQGYLFARPGKPFPDISR